MPGAQGYQGQAGFAHGGAGDLSGLNLTGSAKAQIAADLAATPLGSGGGEPGQVAANATKEIVLVRVRNLSAIRERRTVIEKISFVRGGEQYEADVRRESKGRSVVDLNALRARSFFDDVSPTVDKIAPIDIALTFDSGMYVLPAYAEGHEGEPEHAAPWVEVPDGCYDLYVGSFQRLNDPRERAKELERVKSRRMDYVIRAGGGGRNPWAFIEFERTVITPRPMAVDMEKVFAGDLVEV